MNSNREYPERLIPKVIDRLIEFPDKSSKLYRRSLQEIIIDEIPHSDLESKKMWDYSTNIVPRSMPQDVNIRVLSDKYLATWECGMDGLIPNEGEFLWETNHAIYYFSIKEIHLAKYTELTFEHNDIKCKLDIELIIKHDPTVCNITHFVIIPLCVFEEISTNRSFICDSSDKFPELFKFFNISIDNKSGTEKILKKLGGHIRKVFILAEKKSR